MAGEWINGSDFQWLKPTQPDRTFMVGMELGMRAQHQRLSQAVAIREMQSKVKLDAVNARLKEAEITAHEQLAEGNAELATALSQTAGRWTTPEAKSQFWGIAARYPQVMKSPQFKELVDNFQLADQAESRRQFLDAQIGGRMDLEATKQQHRMESLTTRLDRMADMKMDDQDFKTQFEGLQQEHRLERDKLKASTGVQERFDLNKSDEIAFRSELQSLQTAFNQGVVDQDSFSKLQESVITKYKAKARQPAQPTGTAPPAKRIRVKAPDGTIGHIPEGQLDEAKRSGYTLAE